MSKLNKLAYKYLRKNNNFKKQDSEQTGRQTCGCYDGFFGNESASQPAVHFIVFVEISMTDDAKLDYS